MKRLSQIIIAVILLSTFSQAFLFSQSETKDVKDAFSSAIDDVKNDSANSYENNKSGRRVYNGNSSGSISKQMYGGPNFLQKTLHFIAIVILQLLRLYKYIWIGLIIVSWLQAFGILHIDRYHPVIDAVYRITYDFVDFLFGGRRLIIGMLDLTPLLLFLIIMFLESVLVPSFFGALINLAGRLG